MERRLPGGVTGKPVTPCQAQEREPEELEAVPCGVLGFAGPVRGCTGHVFVRGAATCVGVSKKRGDAPGPSAVSAWRTALGEFRLDRNAG